MPRGDRTGPMGMGAMSGRKAGFCAGYSTPGYMNTIQGGNVMGFGRNCRRNFGNGMGMGMGMGWRRGWAFPGTPSTMQPVPQTGPDELSTLRNQAKYYDEAIQSIKSRISELETNA